MHVYLGAFRAWFSQWAIWTPGPLCESNMKHTFEHHSTKTVQYVKHQSVIHKLTVCSVNSEITATSKPLVCILGLLGGFSLMSQRTTPTNIPGVSEHCCTTTQVGWQIKICKYNPRAFSLLSTLPGLFRFQPISCFHLVSPSLYLCFLWLSVCSCLASSQTPVPLRSLCSL